MAKVSKATETKAHKIAEKLERSGADVKTPYAVGMAQAKKGAAKKKG